MLPNWANRMPSVPLASSNQSTQNFFPTRNAWQNSNNGQAACSPDALLNNQTHNTQQSAATPALQFQASAYAEQHMRAMQSLHAQSPNTTGHAVLPCSVDSAANPHMGFNQLQSRVSSLTLDLGKQKQLVDELRRDLGIKQREVDKLKRDLGSSEQALKSQCARMDKSWMTKTKHATEMAKQQGKLDKQEQEVMSLRQQYKSEQFALSKESKRQKQEYMSRIAFHDKVLGRTREHVVALEQMVTEQTKKLRERSRIIQEMQKRDEDCEYHLRWVFGPQK